MNLCQSALKLTFKVILAISGFLIGLTCSLLFYEFVLRETEFEDAYKVLLFLSVATFLSLGFAFSTQLACITLLTLPEFTGRAGRRSLQATIIILILAGPLKNLGENGEETLRFFVCIKDMLWDIFMAGVDLVLAPVQHILLDLKASATQTGQNKNFNASEVDHMMEPFFQEVEGTSEIQEIKVENDRIDREIGITERWRELEGKFVIGANANESERIVKTYQKKLAARCERIFHKGTQSCVNIFQTKYSECEEKVGDILAVLLCWPMKLEFVCNILSDFSMEKTCSEVESLVGDNFGEGYVFIKKGLDDFTKSFKFRINYEGFSELINLDSVTEKRDQLLEEFLKSKEYIEWYLSLIKRSLTLSYLFVLFSALSYYKSYMAKFSFDNVYLSSHFRKIDSDRATRKKRTLLPLKTFEQSELTPVWRFWLTPAEKKNFANQLFAVVLQAAIAFSFFAFDYLYKELLELLQNHAEIEIQQEGVHVLAIQIKGEGFLAQLMRRIVQDFEVKREIDMKHFTKPCLPIPKETDPSYYQRVLILFSCLFLNIYLETHFSRLRHSIPDFFYGKRYKKRAVWLYNEMLRRRRRKFTHLKRKALENGEKFKGFMPQNPLQLLANYFPRRCACLKRWKLARKKCLLCLANGSIYNCPRCGLAYCQPCFADVDQTCLYCLARREEEERMRENDYDDYDDYDMSNGQDLNYVV